MTTDDGPRTSLFEFEPGQYILGVENAEVTEDARRYRRSRVRIEIVLLLAWVLAIVLLLQLDRMPRLAWVGAGLLALRSIRCLRPREAVGYRAFAEFRLDRRHAAA